MLKERTKPMQSNGRMFYGLLTINDAGLIVGIDVVVNNNLFSVDTDPSWIRSTFDFTFNDVLRWREIIKQSYADKLSKDLV